MNDKNTPLEKNVTIVIPNWNTQHWLAGCLDGLRKQTYSQFKTVLVDNGSTDNSITFVQTHYPEVEVLALGENKGFAAAVNAGIKWADTAYIVLLNADTIPRSMWLHNLVETIENSPPEVGSLASKMLSLDNPHLIDDAGDTLSWYGSARKRGFGEAASKYNKLQTVFSACAGAALYRKDFLVEVGEFDERFTSYLEDIDIGLRGQLLGYNCLYVPTAEILHKGQGAGTVRPYYVYLMTRNRLVVLLKNIPLWLLLKHSFTLLFGQFYYFLVYKHPLMSLKGVFAFIKMIPYILQQRQVIQRQKRISNKILEQLLSNKLGEIPLREIIKNRLFING